LRGEDELVQRPPILVVADDQAAIDAADRDVVDAIRREFVSRATRHGAHRTATRAVAGRSPEELKRS
jgi:hypothetical protein